MPDFFLLRLLRTGFFSCLLLLLSCEQPATESKAPLEQVSWLLGKWSAEMDNGIIAEEWKQVNDSLFEGVGSFVMNGDTLSSETLQLRSAGGELYYIPTVKNQNEGKAVFFKYNPASENELRFENKEHDFPQYISYRQVGQDSLIAEIGGVINESVRKETFPMKRVE